MIIHQQKNLKGFKPPLKEQITSKQKHQLLTIKIIKDPKFLLTDDFIFDSIT